MAKIYSEAVHDKISGKWGFYVKHEIEGVLLAPIYIFDTKQAAEQELVNVLRDISDLAKND